MAYVENLPLPPIVKAPGKQTGNKELWQTSILNLLSSTLEQNHKISLREERLKVNQF